MVEIVDEMLDVLSARSFLTGSEGEVRPHPLVLPLYVTPLAPE